MLLFHGGKYYTMSSAPVQCHSCPPRIFLFQMLSSTASVAVRQETGRSFHRPLAPNAECRRWSRGTAPVKAWVHGIGEKLAVAPLPHIQTNPPADFLRLK